MAVNPEIDLASGFRRMTFADIAKVLEIETSVYTHPWTKGIFSDCIRVGYHCWVLEQHGEVIAYGLVSIAANEAHVLNICVSPEKQGEGLGRRMLYKLMQLAEERLSDTIFLEVRESNLVAQKLYEKEGFNRLGIRKDYYPAEEGREDALVYGKALNLDKMTSDQ